MKTDALTKTIITVLIAITLYSIGQYVWGPKEWWNTSQLIWGLGVVVVVGAVTFFGNRISRKRKRL